MSDTPHDLGEEFPNDHDILRHLKMNNAHYVTLAERYHDVNDEIHRIEVEIETPSDEYTEQLKRKRLALIDEISVMVRDAKEAQKSA